MTGQLTKHKGNPLTGQVSSDTCSSAAGYLETNSRCSNGRGEDARTSCNEKQRVGDKLDNPGWCATWPHSNIVKAAVVNILNFKSVLSNIRAGLEFL